MAGSMARWRTTTESQLEVGLNLGPFNRRSSWVSNLSARRHGGRGENSRWSPKLVVVEVLCGKVKMGSSSPIFRGENFKKYLSYHQLVCVCGYRGYHITHPKKMDSFLGKKHLFDPTDMGNLLNLGVWDEETGP